MRILPFQRKWDKLKQLGFTTFRYPRADKDWQVGEIVQIVIKPRSKNREYMGTAEIVKVEPIEMKAITEGMAIEDGFKNKADMMLWLAMTYRNQYRWLWHKPMNRLTLGWVERVIRTGK